jgi:RNA polymerase sigma-70 factor (ECF subfamily)
VAAPAAAEDLASQTWLAVVRSLDRFQGNEPAFRAWVFTIARHEVLDWRRRAARRPATDQPVNGLVERAAHDDPPPPPWGALPPGLHWQWSLPSRRPG